MIEGTFS